MNPVLDSNIRHWREVIGNASAKWGGAEICGVTKTVDVDTINEAYESGIRVIGENRVQELQSKIERLNPNFEIHVIGGLQTNKVKSIFGMATTVQSLDREALADELSRRAVAADTVMHALIQVNIGHEDQKSGVDEELLVPFVEYCSKKPNLAIDGLMAIMPFVDDPETIRPLFKRMRGYFEMLRDKDIPNVTMKTLSMGMSGDCDVAAEEGATMVRLGRALFGARPIKQTKEV
ncbi:MAG: YggS family pyridoxal phosphate-dependent enzyme [Clostridia bacterium]|nr:YggS family pyridoxal phosphate-dependent enzyme [Clostridia bacterium]